MKDRTQALREIAGIFDSLKNIVASISQRSDRGRTNDD
jgi:hypothetical protein